jgi:hypothetical protein
MVQPEPITPETRPVLRSGRKGILFRSISASGRYTIATGAAGRTAVLIRNNLDFPPEARRWVEQQAWTVHFPEAVQARYVGIEWILTAVADADEHRQALIALEQIAGELPVMNAPSRVVPTRRDLVADLLQGIPGLEVPRCIRLRPRQPGDFLRAAQAAALAYPILARPAGSQTGRGLLRIERPADWGQADARPFATRAWYLTEWRDSAVAGIFRKGRYIWIGDGWFARHMMQSEHWQVHTQHAWPRDAVQCRWQQGLFAAMERDAAVGLILAEVRRRIGLDYFGLDFGLKADGSFLFFEANAAMSFFARTYDERTVFPSERERRRAEAAALRLVTTPGLWTGPATVSAAEALGNQKAPLALPR